MQIEKFPLGNLNQVYLDKYLKQLRLNIDLRVNEGIRLIPEYYDELLTTYTTIDLAVNYNPAVIILRTQMIHEPLKEFGTFNISTPNSATEIMTKINESMRFIEGFKTKLEKNLFKLFIEEPDYETYIFGQFNFGLLKGELRCGT